MAHDVIILAGGRGRRLAGSAPHDDKALVDVGGRTLLERALAASREAARVVVVGPDRVAAYADHVTWCREDPPGGGPVAALGAALPLLSAALVVVLAVDHPFADRSVVRELLDAADGHDGACGIDAEGRKQPLVAAYGRTALAAALARTSPLGGARVRDLVAGLELVEVPIGLAALDCDTSGDVERARAAATRREDPHGDAAGMDDGTRGRAWRGNAGRS